MKEIKFLFTAIALVILASCTGNDDNNKTTTLNETPSERMQYDTNKMANNTNSMNDTTNKNNTMTNSENSMMEDSLFLVKVAEINREEIKLGNLAQKKGTMAHIKEMGKMMVTEHTQAMAGLNTLAKTKMINLPTTEGQKIMDAYKMLSEKKGKDFDKAYSDMMVNGHKEAIALFEKTNSDTKDADVKKMTTAMIPKLKTHLEQAEICQKECQKM